MSMFEPPTVEVPAVTDDAPAPPPPPPPPVQPRPGRWAALTVACSLAAGVIGGVVGAAVDKDGTTTTNTIRTSLPPSRSPSAAAPADLQDLVAKVEQSVVTIRVRGGEGTGVILTANGEVLTNAHVVEGSSTANVTIAGASGSRQADVVRADTDADLALLRLKDASGLTPADLGASGAVRVGDDVVAIGNALGLRGDPSVTRGIVSGLNRSIGSLTGMIQTDAAINPGNSGGPLVDSQGRVIGINTAVRGNAQNIGFAIPIDAAKAFVDRARSGQSAPEAGFLGVSTEEPDDGSPGASVASVEPSSGAAKAGLRTGDRIIAVDGTAVPGPAELGGVIRSKKPGDTVELRVVRNGKELTIKATLGTRPAD